MPPERAKSFDLIVIGYHDRGKLIYAGRTRNGFTPSSRPQHRGDGISHPHLFRLLSRREL